MRLPFRRLAALFILSLVVSVTPAFADGCETCATDSWGTTVVTYCREVRGGEMGNLKCRVECYTSDELGICECSETGDWCMVIVVEG